MWLILRMRLPGFYWLCKCIPGWTYLSYSHKTASRSTRKSARSANRSCADWSALLTVYSWTASSQEALPARSRRDWRAQCHHRLPLLVAVDHHKWCQWVLQAKSFPDTSQCPVLSLVETSNIAQQDPWCLVWTDVYKRNNTFSFHLTWSVEKEMNRNAWQKHPATAYCRSL